jgi:hypothetical protein
VYSADSTLVLGSRLFYDSALTNEILFGYYWSDGTTCYYYPEIDGFGEITSITLCATPTPTPTETPTPTPTIASEDCWQCSVDFTIYNDQVECSNSCTGGSCNQVVCP